MVHLKKAVAVVVAGTASVGLLTWARSRPFPTRNGCAGWGKGVYSVYATHSSRILAVYTHSPEKEQHQGWSFSSLFIVNGGGGRRSV